MADPPTDERFMPGHGGPGIHLEHVHRYRVAAAVVEGRVLDLGCGSGYGARLLAAEDRAVVGVDRSAEAIHFARETFGGAGVEFLRGAVQELPFPKRAFDSVVCFELIEHVEEYARVLAEVKRVLRPGGLFLISTPNRPQYSELPDYQNPFHTQEWDQGEFNALLGDVFPHVHLWGQRLVAGSRVWNFSSLEDAAGAWTYPLAESPAADLGHDRAPVYFLAACSTRALKKRVISKVPSVLGARLESFLEEQKQKIDAYTREAGERYEAEVAKLRDHLTHYQNQNDELREWTGRQQTALEALKSRTAQLEKEAEEALARRTVLEVEAAREKERREHAEAETARGTEEVRKEREGRDQAEARSRQKTRRAEEERRRRRVATEETARERRRREEAEASRAAAAEELARERRRREEIQGSLEEEARRRAEDQRVRRTAERSAARERKRRQAVEAAQREITARLEKERARRREAEEKAGHQVERRKASKQRADQRTGRERKKRRAAEAGTRVEAGRRKAALADAAHARERQEELESRLRAEARWRFEERRRREAAEARVAQGDTRRHEAEEELAAALHRGELEQRRRAAAIAWAEEERRRREDAEARAQELERMLEEEVARREEVEERVMIERGGRIAAETESRERGRQLDEERARLHLTESEVARGWDEVVAMRATKVWKLMVAYNWLQARGRGAYSFLRRAVLWTLVTPARLLGGGFLLTSLGLEELMARLRGRQRRGRIATPAPAVDHAHHPRRPRVLIVSPYKVHPPDHGGGVRIFNLVRRLARTCDLHLLIFNQAGDDTAQREALSAYCRSVNFHHWRPSLHPDLLGLQPPNAQLFASDEAVRQIREILRVHAIDILQLEYTELGQFGSAAGETPVVLTEHDIARRQHERRRKLAFHRRYPEGNDFGSTYFDWVRTARYELGVCRRAERVLVMSEDDADFLAGYLSDGRERIRIAPNAVDTGAYGTGNGDIERRGVLFLGNYQNLPNVDALEYFLADVWPLVRLSMPDATLTVAGANPSERVLRVDGRDGVRVIGRVPDLRRTYQEHRVMIAPLRAGSGTRLKILEAFSSGLPVVSTTIGAEGIECVNDEHLLLADDPVPLARAVERLLRDDELCAKLSRNARRLAEERYDWDLSARSCLETYHELLGTNGFDHEQGDAIAGASPAGNGRARDGHALVDITVVIPTRNGGELLERALENIFTQETDRTFEVVCVDSASTPENLERMRRFPVHIHPIDPQTFNHGLTRDLGAELGHGEVVVFVNQDAVPCDTNWLARLTEPLFTGDENVVAVQGGIQEVPDLGARFFWDSCGSRFYFTRESNRWIAAHGGVGFSTVNAAMRRSVWRAHPFGWAPIMEDKKWQQIVSEAGFRIAERHDACVYHTHDYDLGSLVRRCESEGYGWRTLGENYSLISMLLDMIRPRVHAELIGGLFRGRVRTPAEFLFPVLRPLALFRGNHFGKGVKH